MIRAKMKPFPFVRMFLASIPAEEGAEILGISIKTFQRRKQEPESLTIGELKRLMAYMSAKGEAPAELIREFTRKDLSL